MSEKIGETGVKRYSPSGISVLIVGAGPAGLFTALECWRKGHDVRIIERTPVLSTEGDYFTIAPQIIRHIQNTWPGLSEENERIAEDPWISYHNVMGEKITGPDPVYFGAKSGHRLAPKRLYRHNRPKFMRALVAQLREIGIEVSYGHRVVDYSENKETQKAGVVLEDGGKLEADVVVAADGLGTKSHKLVNGHDIRAIPTGYSIYRTAYPAELAAADPVVDQRFKLLQNGHPHYEMWAGPDLHVSICRYADLINWAMTHRDDEASVESWNARVPIEKVLSFTSKIPGWPEYMDRLIKTTPADGIVDWKLMLRDPQQVTTSPLGHVVQVGDAAHSFLPFSGNGANQGMEDAITLASCLAIGGKDNICWAAKIHEKLRFQRVACCQLVGFINFRHQHNTDWDAAKKDPNSVKSEIGSWIWVHEPEQYANEKYNEVLQHLQAGTEFHNTNIPPGYVYQPFTFNTLFALIKEGKFIELSGDWS